MTTGRFVIAMDTKRGFPPVFLKTNLCWCAWADDAAQFDTRAAADRALADAGVSMKPDHFACAAVEQVA